jgi:hypothetical protein
VESNNGVKPYFGYSHDDRLELPRPVRGVMAFWSAVPNQPTVLSVRFSQGGREGVVNIHYPEGIP